MKKLLEMLPYYLIISMIFVIVMFGSDSLIDVLSQQKEQQRKTTIIIDAGHGGEDGGASTATGVPESKINLDIAIRLNDLCNLIGWNTKMIRTDDRSVYTLGNTLSQKKVSDLKERVRICNSTQNAVLLSIHQNYFSDGKYTGTQVFYADSENSKMLAQHIQSTICNSMQRENHRSIKKATGLYLMEKIRCTGVLVECGFLSNTEEANLLQNPDYQKKFCCAMVSAFNSYIAESCRYLDRVSFH